VKLLVLLWILWCALHSLLITDRVANRVQHMGGIIQGGYRLFYVLFACLSLAPLLWYQYSLPQQLLFAWHGPWRILQAGLLLYGLIMFQGGRQVYDSNYFLGISQWRSYRQSRQPAPLPFRCQGVLRYVRHPWYSGGLAVLWALGPITDVSLAVKLILSLYVILGTLLEERKLERQLGTPYREYCRQVPMLIPWRGRVNLDSRNEQQA
jgi:protein-S-isoprenylcysteine O-methyltransferase Ste14